METQASTSDTRSAQTAETVLPADTPGHFVETLRGTVLRAQLDTLRLIVQAIYDQHGIQAVPF